MDTERRARGVPHHRRRTDLGEGAYIDDRTGAIDVAMDPSDPGGCARRSGGSRAVRRAGSTAARMAAARGRNSAAACPRGPSAAATSTSRAPIREWYVFLDNWAPAPAGARNREIAGGEVYRSDDRGDTWKKANTDDLYPVFGIYGWKFCDIRVSPDNENEIYILGNRAFHSTDGGARISASARSSGACTTLPERPCTSIITNCGSTPPTPAA